MRTTIDLPEDLHRVAMSLARDQHTTLSEAVALLLRRGIEGSGEVTLDPPNALGLRLLRVGRPVTSEDVRSLEDDW